MASKKLIACFLAASTLTGVVAALGATRMMSLSTFSAGENVRWTHFARVEATDTERGVKEYWSPCTGGEPVFEAPVGVAISEGTKDTSLFTATDERWIPSHAEQAVIDMIDGLGDTGFSAMSHSELAAKALYLDAITQKRAALGTAEFIDSRTTGSYATYKAALDNYAVVILSGDTYQDPWKEWARIPKVDHEVLGTVYTREIDGTHETATPQIYSTQKLYRDDCYAVGTFVNFPNAGALSYYSELGNGGSQIIKNATPNPGVWNYVEGGETPAFTTAATLSYFNYWMEDGVTRAGTYQLTSIVGFKKGAVGGTEIQPDYEINSDANAWASFTQREDTIEHGRVVVADLTNSTTVCWNGVEPVECGKYVSAYIDIYNPTGTDVAITFSAFDNAWNHFESVHPTLKAGWNRVNFPASMLEYYKRTLDAEGNPKTNLLNMPVSDAMKTAGWKFSRIQGVKRSETVDMGTLAVNSQLTGWDPCPTEQNPDYGTVYVLDTTAPSGGTYGIVWNNVASKRIVPGTYKRIAFHVYNPTGSDIHNVAFNVADTAWATLQTVYVSLKAGWSTVCLPTSFFELENGAMFSINVPAADYEAWSGVWKIAGFQGLK